MSPAHNATAGVACRPCGEHLQLVGNAVVKETMNTQYLLLACPQRLVDRRPLQYSILVIT